VNRPLPAVSVTANPSNGEEAPPGVREFEQIWHFLSSANRVLIVTHAHPDADAVSSVLAVADALAARGQQATPATGDGELPEALAFLPGAERLVAPSSLDIEDFDVIAMLDCAEPHRVGPLFRKHPDWFDGRRPIVNVDHHVTNPRFGVASLVDPTAAATCELLALMFIELNIPMQPDVATCLMAGIYGDTLGLRTPSTTSRTFRVTAELLDRSADHVLIIDHLFRIKPFSTIKLWGEALQRAQMIGDLVWTEITPEMLSSSGAVPAEGEGIVNFITGTAGARAGALFYLQEHGWRVSLRSIGEDVDVAVLAQSYGGGGHSRAAGCTLPPGVEARDAFLRDIVRQLSELEHPRHD
jgi:phosphoesterase RecJ-like protein